MVQIRSEGSVAPAARRVRVLEAPSRVDTGSTFTINGQVDGGAGRRLVRLDVRRGATQRAKTQQAQTQQTGWQRLRTTRATKAGTFTLAVPAGSEPTTLRLRLRLVSPGSEPTDTVWFKVRVVRSTTGPDSQPTPVAEDQSPAGSATDWTYLFANGGARWDPCQPIGWGYDPAGGYLGALTDLQTAFARVAEHTGLTFSYQGTAGDDLTISWSTQAKDAQLAGAIAGYTVASATPLPAGSADVAYRLVEANMVLDAESPLRTGHASGGDPTWGQIMTHEALHAVGLGHAAGTVQLMHGQATTANHKFGAGDLTGMARTGVQGGCLPEGYLFRPATLSRSAPPSS